MGYFLYAFLRGSMGTSSMASWRNMEACHEIGLKRCSEASVVGRDFFLEVRRPVYVREKRCFSRDCHRASPFAMTEWGSGSIRMGQAPSYGRWVACVVYAFPGRSLGTSRQNPNVFPGWYAFPGRSLGTSRQNPNVFPGWYAFPRGSVGTSDVGASYRA